MTGWALGQEVRRRDYRTSTGVIVGWDEDVTRPGTLAGAVVELAPGRVMRVGFRDLEPVDGTEVFLAMGETAEHAQARAQEVTG